MMMPLPFRSPTKLAMMTTMANDLRNVTKKQRQIIHQFPNRWTMNDVLTTKKNTFSFRKQIGVALRHRRCWLMNLYLSLEHFRPLERLFFGLFHFQNCHISELCLTHFYVTLHFIFAQTIKKAMKYSKRLWISWHDDPKPIEAHNPIVIAE